MKRNSSKNAVHSSKKHSGFTLVELVVVIAVLAILAGVGAVAYKGYIAYAKRANDEELLSAVNTAFAATCEDQGVERIKLKTYDATLKGGKGGKTITGVNSVANASDLPAFKSAFDGYFEGNTETELQYYKKSNIIFDGDDHRFKFSEGDELSKVLYEKLRLAFGGKGKFVNALTEPVEALVKTFESKTFLGYSLLNPNKEVSWRVSQICKYLEGFGLDFDSEVVAEEFKKDLESLGVDLNATTEVSNTELVNKIMMCIAQETINGDVDTDTLIDAVLSGDKQQIQDAGGGLAALPMLFVRLSGYRYSEFCKNSDNFTKYYGDLFGLWGVGFSGDKMTSFEKDFGNAQLNDNEYNFEGYNQQNDTKTSDGWNQYVESGKAKEDLNAYLAALQMFVNSSDKVDFSSPTMISDFFNKNSDLFPKS